eukprot:CAMPEP_0117427100 /NCGR_PEP_ID=MMETSP0758-20121206/7036_1 /TAXON_ID=63605 /ORGANISM="Percolomonas cosmopolitus, Strain AE-1 (ATCC 50343)" /LENGTH=498 /DNA_ID=CAMNT_0005212575 /DNA_START=55 /DNA_END=1548 /DNA_ORIENTATION=-
MWGRKTAYETKDDSTENLERMSKRFAADLRIQVKKIGSPKLFSKQWLALTETLENVSKIAGIENKSQTLLNVSQNSKNTPVDTTSSSSGFVGQYPKKSQGNVMGLAGFKGSPLSNSNRMNKEFSVLNRRHPSSSSSIMAGSSSSLLGMKKSSIYSPGKKKYNQQVKGDIGVMGTLSASTVVKKQNKDHKQTLWEKEEYCVRYMVEEGKVCVLLRQFLEFKELQHKLYNTIEYPDVTYSSYAESSGLSEEALKLRMEKYEESAGSLLRCCFASVEALQTLDMPLFFDHIQLVLKFAIHPSYQPPTTPISMAKKQEYLIFEYIYLMCRDIEKLSEESICSRFLEMGIMDYAIQFLLKRHDNLPTSACFNAAVALSKFMELEYFATHRDKFFNTLDKKRALISMKKVFLNNLLTSYARKRALRTLIELITYFNLKISSSTDHQDSDQDDDEFFNSSSSTSTSTTSTSNSLLGSGGSTFQQMFANRRAFLSSAGSSSSSSNK